MDLKSPLVTAAAGAIGFFDPKLAGVIVELQSDLADGKITYEEATRLFNKVTDEAVTLFPQVARLINAIKALITQGQPLVEEVLAAIKELKG